MPRFQVRETFALHDKTTFVLAGFILEGEPKPGMIARIPFSVSVVLTAEIDRIEYVRRPDGDVVCLCIQCKAVDEVNLWDTLHLRNRTIELVPPNR